MNKKADKSYLKASQYDIGGSRWGLGTADPRFTLGEKD
jgi:hypothetical protein